MLEEEFSNNLQGVKVAVFGLAFKPGSDDVRESPAISVIKNLLAKGTHIKTFDPIVRDIESLPFGSAQLQSVDSVQKAIEGVQAALIMTGWEDFKQLPELMRETNPSILLVDGRRMIDKNGVKNYRGIGLGAG